jgi:V8-like Glu-specific endopeptidase
VIANSGGPGDPPVERVVDPAEMSGFGFEPQANPGPFAFTGYRLFPNVTALYKEFPYVFVGKVFFTIPGQGNFVCSGSVVSAPNRSLVWTAGHCVYSPGIGFHTNFVFVPARREGTNPFGSWTANTLGTTTGWQSGLFEYDHGAAFMNPGGPQSNWLIGQFGFLGFAVNLPRQQHWHLQGYPAEGPPDGEHHYLCATDWSTDDQPTGTPGVDPETIGVGCDMLGGSSGGPWTLDLSGQPGTDNVVNGNTSYRYIGIPNRLYGPYFGDAALALRNQLGNM